MSDRPTPDGGDSGTVESPCGDAGAVDPSGDAPEPAAGDGGGSDDVETGAVMAGAPTGEGGFDPARSPPVVARRIRRRAAEIERRELAEGTARFEAGGPATDEQREILGDLADDLVEALLAAPMETLSETDDPQAVETAIDLFDPER